MSIKGLINIGPELAITGSMDTSLTFAGAMQAGVSAKWEKTEVYFPQDSDGEDATVEPSGLNPDSTTDDQPQYLITPEFEASATASGHINLNLTPKVRFGISVLGGKLSGGFVTAGVENTMSIGFESSSNTGFCYWADYLYNLFVQAEVKFPGDMTYWGSDKFELASPDDPITLIDKKCVPWDKKETVTKRDTGENYDSFSGNIANAPDPKSDGEPIFSALVACPGKNDTIPDDAYSCDSRSSSKRDVSGCSLPPALFYNCDFFPDLIVPNNNQKTNRGSPNQRLTGICNNVKNYLDGHQNDPGVGSNYMFLTYWKGTDNPLNDNRDHACGGAGGPGEQCRDLKFSLWPEDVYDAVKQDKKQTRAKTMPGWTDNMSCDEFPCELSGNGERKTLC